MVCTIILRFYFNKMFSNNCSCRRIHFLQSLSRTPMKFTPWPALKLMLWRGFLQKPDSGFALVKGQASSIEITSCQSSEPRSPWHWFYLRVVCVFSFRDQWMATLQPCLTPAFQRMTDFRRHIKLHSILYTLGLVPTSLTCPPKMTKSHTPFWRASAITSVSIFGGTQRAPITWMAKAHFQIESTLRTTANHIPRRH